MATGVQTVNALLAGASRAVQRTLNYLLETQHPGGYWMTELTADTTLESDYILLQLWLHPPENGVWNPPSRPLVDKAVRSILARQLPDGGFNIYPKGPSEISATVKAYFALKLAGVPYHDPRLSAARERILAMGGIQAANSYVKINLNLFDLYPREGTPSIPPAVVHASNPCRPVPRGFDLKELFTPGVPVTFKRNQKFFTWRNLFLRMDR